LYIYNSFLFFFLSASFFLVSSKLLLTLLFVFFVFTFFIFVFLPGIGIKHTDWCFGEWLRSLLEVVELPWCVMNTEREVGKGEMYRSLQGRLFYSKLECNVI